jgi:hypothetical protein
MKKTKLLIGIIAFCCLLPACSKKETPPEPTTYSFATIGVKSEAWYQISKLVQFNGVNTYTPIESNFVYIGGNMTFSEVFYNMGGTSKVEILGKSSLVVSNNVQAYKIKVLAPNPAQTVYQSLVREILDADIYTIDGKITIKTNEGQQSATYLLVEK